MSTKSKVVGSLLNAYLSSRPAKHGAYSIGRVLRGGKRHGRLYYRADDPYSHLLVQVAPRLRDVYGLRLDIVPVAEPGLGANPAPEMLQQHAMRDAAVIAERFGLSFPAAATGPPEDRVRRAHAVLLEPRAPAVQLDVAREVGDAVWNDDGEALARIVERRGGISGESVRPALEANYAALERAGHYQPGMIHYGGDWYWGIDRLCHLEARFAREGAKGSLGLEPRLSTRLGSALESAVRERAPIEVFFSFRSPYSYVAIPQLMALRERYGVPIKVRPVLPMVMRGLAVPRAKRLYIAFDAKREADRLGIPFGHVYDPLGKGIGHCMAVFFTCVDGTDRELELVHSIGRGVWSEARDVAHLPDLIELAGRAGVDEAAVRAAVGDESWKARAAANRDTLTGLGLWGVPSFRFGPFVTWGQDRLSAMEAEIAGLSAAP